jgi:hypothetical protein
MPPRKARTETEAPEGATQERSPAESFDAFLESVPDTDRVTVSLRRMPSYITPDVTTQESLPPPVFQSDLEAMQGEVRRRYGPGRYKLWVRWRHPETRNKDRITAPEFTLAPVEEDFSPIKGEPAADAGDTAGAVQDSLAHLARAAKIKAQATELGALRMAVDGGPASAVPADPLAQLSQLATVFKAIMPQDNSLAMLVKAKEILAPAAAQDPAGTLSLLDKLGDVLQKFAGEGGASRSEGFWSFATEAMRVLGPNLPGILDVASQVLARSQAGGVSTPVAPSIPAATEARPLPENSPQAIVRELTGGDPHAHLALVTWLNMALVEVSGLMATTNPQNGYSLLLDYLDSHLPWILQRWESAPPESVWSVWSTLDPRVVKIPAARPWLDGLLQAAKAPAEAQPEGADGQPL